MLAKWNHADSLPTLVTSRRRFLGAILAAMLSRPGGVHARPAASVHRVAFVNPGLEEDVVVFRERLRELGYLDARNLELRVFEDDQEAVIRQAVAWSPHLIKVCYRKNVAMLRRLTATIPIVFSRVGGFRGREAAELGVESTSRPGGNVTGVYLDFNLSKRLELARMIVPGAKRVAIFFDSESLTESAKGYFTDANMLATAQGIQLVKVDYARFKSATPEALESIEKAPIDALIVDGEFRARPQIEMEPHSRRRNLVMAFQKRKRIPVIGGYEGLAVQGALACVGPDYRELTRLAADQAAMILNGANPATLPVVFGRRTRLVVNARSAREIGITLSPEVLLLADRVIE